MAVAFVADYIEVVASWVAGTDQTEVAEELVAAEVARNTAVAEGLDVAGVEALEPKQNRHRPNSKPAQAVLASIPAIYATSYETWIRWWTYFLLIHHLDGSCLPENPKHDSKRDSGLHLLHSKSQTTNPPTNRFQAFPEPG